MVWDRQAGIHAATVGGRSRSRRSAAQLKIGWRFCEPADPQAKGAVERLQGYAETNFEPGRRFANELDFQDQLNAWFAKVNARMHKTLRARPIDRLAHELALMAPLPNRMPDTAGAGSPRVPPDPHLRFDTNDYSLDPGPGRPARRGARRPAEVTAVALDTGELACRHARVFARTARSPRSSTPAPSGPAAAIPRKRPVEVRPLARYDQLIA